eukprot:2526123-Amphidinium_carterae.1
MELQGFNLFGDRTAATHCPFAEYVESHPTLCAQLAGNGLHIGVATALVAFLLSTTSLTESAE